ncbi:transcriptional regulator [Methylobacterium sp. BTF04]|uniref:methanogen output domain 1-containing protein n=1 Tax=Methylobacterium sp. BTF04 TaxID=2708300 RepID=UPI0013D197DD|nr:methanogen output domain 1-containing protein [Methylobacterium sp. BTF04]NEU13468.1 transcriptional regulator [Methylobacterium sp. BTF04]
MIDPGYDTSTDVLHCDIGLDHDIFLRTLIRELSGTLQDVVGLDEAAGFISIVGRAVGEQIERDYLDGLQTDRLAPGQVTGVLLDLKRRIHGDFHVVAETKEMIVLENHICPFGRSVDGRPSLCMMTSNVFGHIAAQAYGYVRVELQETIAEGDARCCVRLHLAPDADDVGAGIEYFRRDVN